MTRSDSIPQGKLAQLRAATGSPRQLLGKLWRALVTLVTMLNPWERNRRYARLEARGLTGPRPTGWQMTLGAYRMLTEFLLPSNEQFYELAGYDNGHWWAQVLRVLDEPSATIDPIGLGVSQDLLIQHLIQVVHTSAAYDVALLGMFDDGLDALRAQLQQLEAGTHPRQQAPTTTIERPDYPAKLLAALDRFERDPETHWRVTTYPTPAGCETLFDWGIDRFGTPGKFFAYCRTLPASPWQSLRGRPRESQRLRAA